MIFHEASHIQIGGCSWNFDYGAFRIAQTCNPSESLLAEPQIAFRILKHRQHVPADGLPVGKAGELSTIQFVNSVPSAGPHHAVAILKHRPHIAVFQPLVKSVMPDLAVLPMVEAVSIGADP